MRRPSKFEAYLIELSLILIYIDAWFTCRNYFMEALEAISPPLNADQKRKADEILERVKRNMRLQLLCFSVKEP